MDRDENTTITIHLVWAMVGLAAILILTGGVLGLFRPDGGQTVIGLAAIATPVLMGLMQLMRQQQMHEASQHQLADNTQKTEEIKTIVNGERTAMAAQIDQLREQVRTLTGAATKIDSVVVKPGDQP